MRRGRGGGRGAAPQGGTRHPRALRGARALSLAVLLLAGGCRIETRVGQSAIDADGDGYTVRQGDCDDDDPDRWPDNVEVCDGIDNDCVGGVDDEGACNWIQRAEQGAMLDVLFIVDDSPSMFEERTRIADGVFQFVRHAIQPEHSVHIGVITAEVESPEAGRLREVDGVRWASEEMDLRGANGWLRRAFDIQGDGSADEKPRAAVQWALDEHIHDYNANFMRDGADLALVVLSDEDDSTVHPSIDEFLDWLTALKGVQDVTYHAIVGLPGDEDCAGAIGRDHIAVVERTQGYELSVCEEDYGPFLFLLGQIVTQDALRNRFALDYIPRRASLRVELLAPGEGRSELVDGRDFTWIEQTNEVLLIDPPRSGAELTFLYERVP